MPPKPLMPPPPRSPACVDPQPAARGSARQRAAQAQAAAVPSAAQRLTQAALHAAREDERQHLAHELHDVLGAHLTALRYALARLEPGLAGAPAQGAELFDAAEQALDALSDAGRRLMVDLQAPGADTSLLASLAQWSAQFQTFTGLPVGLICAADPRLTRLRPAAATALFRIAQEAVNNAAKHARTARIDLRISAGPRYLQLCVTDYGQGFKATARPRRGHFGIDGMRERCKALGGRLQISSQAAQATQVTARLPWSAILRDAQAGADRGTHDV